MGDQQRVRHQAHPGHQRAHGDALGDGRHRAEDDERGQSGTSRLAERPEMVEDEHPVEPEAFGPSSRCDGCSIVAEGGEGDADLHL